MEMKKQGMGLKVLVVILIIALLGSVGYICYDKLLSSKTSSDKETELNTKTENNSTTTETKEQTITKTSNDYSLFVKKLKESRAALFNNQKKLISFDDHENYDWSGDSLSYSVLLEKDGTLKLKYNDNERTLASNVILFRIVYLSNGGYKSLCYVTEDGFVYVVKVEAAIKGETDFKSVKQKSAKEIVSIIPGGSGDVERDDNGEIVVGGGGAAHPYFVDINGNIYPYEYVE